MAASVFLCPVAGVASSGQMSFCAGVSRVHTHIYKSIFLQIFNYIAFYSLSINLLIVEKTPYYTKQESCNNPLHINQISEVF